MPKLVEHNILSDTLSMSARSDSTKGYIPADEGALLDLGILNKTKGLVSLNPNINISKTEITEFLNWFALTPKYPLPPVVRKILCLKRAAVSSSMASIGTHKSARTDQQKTIKLIDEMLKNDGLKDPAAIMDAGRCPIENSKFVAAPVPPPVPQPSSTALALPTPPGAPCVANTSATTPSCHTEVTCDNSGILVLLNEINGKIDAIERLSGAQTTDSVVVSPTAPASVVSSAETTVPPAASQHDDLRSLKTLIETKTQEVLEKIAVASGDVGQNVADARIQIINRLDGVSSSSERTRVISALRGISPTIGLPAIARKLEEISTSIADKSEIRTIIDESKSSILEKVADVDTKIDEVARLIGTNPTLETLLSTVRTEFRSAEVGAAQRSVAQLDALTAATESVKTQSAEARRSIVSQILALRLALLRTIPSVPAPDPRIDALQEGLTAISTTLATTLTELRAQPAQYERIVRELATALREDMSRNIQIIGTSLDNLKTHITERCVPTDNSAEFEALHNDIAALRATLMSTSAHTRDDFKRGILSVNGLLESLQQLISDQEGLGGVREELRIIREAIDRLPQPAELDALRQQIATLERKLSEKNDKVSTLEDALREARDMIDRLTREKEVLKVCIAIADGAIEQLREADAAKETRIQELIRTIEELRRQLSEEAEVNRATIEDLRRRLAAAEAEGVAKDAIIAELRAELKRKQDEFEERIRGYKTLIKKIKEDNLAEFTELQNKCGEDTNVAVEEERKKCIDAVKRKDVEHATEIARVRRECDEAAAKHKRECDEAIATAKRDCDERIRTAVEEAKAQKDKDCDEKIKAAVVAATVIVAPSPDPPAPPPDPPAPPPDPPAPPPDPPAPSPEPEPEPESDKVKINRTTKQYGLYTTTQLNKYANTLLTLDRSMDASERSAKREDVKRVVSQLADMYDADTQNGAEIRNAADSLLALLPRLSTEIASNTTMLKPTNITDTNAKQFIEQVFNKLGRMTTAPKKGNTITRGGVRNKLNSNTYTRKTHK